MKWTVFRTSEDELRRVREEEADRNVRLRNDLEDELERERAERELNERRAQAKIDRLQQEIDALKKARAPEKVRSSTDDERGKNMVHAMHISNVLPCFNLC